MTKDGGTLPPSFVRFWTGDAVSAFGTYITLLAIQTIVVLTLDGDATAVGWVNAARWAPYLVLGLLVGALVDRVRRRPVLVVTDLAQALLLITIPVAWARDALSMPLVLIVVACSGAISLVNGAASMSFIPRLVPRAQLQRAHARIDGADAVAQNAGPALGGLLVTLIGAPFVVLIDAATYVFSAVMIASIRIDEPAREGDAERTHLWHEIVEGVRWIYRGSSLRTLALATHVWFAANAVVVTVVAPYALLVLDLSAFQLGLSVSAAGAGSVVGALTSTACGRRLGTGGAVIAAHSVTTVGVAVMALAGLGTSGWAALGVLAVGQAMHGFAIGLSNSHEMAYRQSVTPDRLQGRTNTTMRSLNRAVIVVVAPLSGLLADALGMRFALWLAVAVFLVPVLMLAASPFRHARLDS
ncbi:MFS transporter [Luteipulveratus mongoliensis]|uniref:MFS transporter n=1 Tax=Luteipulveratus mongoliensis TaxID=571913 RepID=A0A0K1JER1_9MICO|nr:MFS transporter [Luteipulveratus mongoliensis]AKU15085.1 MFS transporter [Luteipulveratus mongoliensis]